ncbi:MAG: DUF2924 domain-containing protein [Devosia sp.]
MKRPSPEAVEHEIAALDTLDVQQLREMWRRLYRTEPPPKIKSGLLRLAVAYRIQEKAFGGLKPASKRQLQAHVAGLDRASSGDAPARPRAPRLAPGTQLIREWNGSTVLVDVVAGGFRWKERSFRTLSAVAVAITGTKWSGPKFFGLTSAASAATKAARP